MYLTERKYSRKKYRSGTVNSETSVIHTFGIFQIRSLIWKFHNFYFKLIYIRFSSTLLNDLFSTFPNLELSKSTLGVVGVAIARQFDRERRAGRCVARR